MENLLRIHIKNNDVTNAVREYTETVCQELFEATELAHFVSVVVKPRKNGQKKVEVTLSSVEGTFRKEQSGKDYYDVLPDIVSNLKQQVLNDRKRKIDIKRHISKELKENYKEELITRYDKEMVRTKNIEPDAYSEEEAISMLENLDHDFFLYVDKVTNKPTVIYNREDGGYGTIQIDSRVDIVNV